VRKILIILSSIAIGFPAAAQQSDKALLKSFGVEDPSIQEPKCFVISRPDTPGIIILLDACSGASWYLEQREPFKWLPIENALPRKPLEQTP
jgi:hypothetical protein